MCDGLLQETIKEFERNMTEMVGAFVENVRALTAQCRQLENQHYERLVDIGVRLIDKGVKTELDNDLADQLQQVSSLLTAVGHESVPKVIINTHARD